MDFTWTSDQKELYKQAADFARAKMNKNLIEEDQQSTFSREKWRACGEMGFLGLQIPDKYGGLELDAISCAYTLEGFGYGCKENGIFLSIGAHLWAVEMPILLYGNEAQKEKYLPKLSSGEWVGAHAISEPQAGSDAMSMSSTVTYENEFAILNGRKTFVTNAPVADLFIVFATSSKKHGFAAINCFVVDKNTPGLTVEAKTSKMGSRTSHMADVILENCRIPVENRIGKANLGYQIFSKIMMWERAMILAPFIGAMQRQIEDCIEYANQREQFGKQIAAYQSISGKIVDMQVRLEAARMLLYKAAWSFDHADPGMPSSIAKLWISESAVQTFLDAIQIFGGYGYATDFEIERNLRDAIGAKLYSGTTEMQKMLIATHLGLKTK